MKACASFLCLACTASLAQPPVFQSETQMVLVDALATGKKGEFVSGLSAKDFRVWEDNKEQTIRSFSQEPGDDPRRLVLFFDYSNLSVTDQIGAHRAAADFIDSVFANEAAHAARQMAVVTFDGSFHVAQNFTANAGRLKEALREVSLANSAPAVRNPNPSPRTLLQAIESLARSLNAAPGRKALVIFTSSGAFAGAAPDDFGSLVQVSNRSNVAVYPVLQPRSLMPDPAGAQTGFPMGRGGMQQPRIGSGQDDGLSYTLANGTGGFVVPAANDLLPQLRKIGQEQAQSYVLGYTPSEPSKPEACHALRVKVDVSGVTLRVRSSYCSTKPQDLLAESRVEQDMEKHAAARPTGPAAAAIQAPYFYIAANVARVHVVMEIPTEALKFEDRKGKAHAEMNVLGIASTSDGAAAARFSDIVKRDFDNQRDLDKFKETPLHYEKEFKIIPGQYNLAVVFSSGGANFGKVDAPVSIPARDPSRLAVSALTLGKEIRPAAELGLEASLIDGGTPLVAGGMQLIPAGSLVFTKSEQAFCYFEVYGPVPAEAAPAAAPVEVRLRILDGKTGAPVWDGGLAKLDFPANGKSILPVGLSLPIASLSPGSYRLELTAADAQGPPARQAVEFAIK